MLVSPNTVDPSFIRAASCTLETVDGKMVPRVAKILDDSRTASAKSPVTAVSAVTKRLPKYVLPVPRRFQNGIERFAKVVPRPRRERPSSCECLQAAEC